MDHKTLKDKIFALYDGELDPAERQSVEAHLGVCRECREVSEHWAKTARVFFKAPQPAASEFFVRSVMNQIHGLESPKPVRAWRLPLRWVIPAAGLAFLLIFAVLPSPQVVSMDTWIFQEASGHLSWVFSNNVPSADETLQLVMEG